MSRDVLRVITKTICTQIRLRSAMLILNRIAKVWTGKRNVLAVTSAGVVANNGSVQGGCA